MKILKKKLWKNKKLKGKYRKYLFFLEKNVENACYGRRPATGVGLLRALACYGRWPASGVGRLRASAGYARLSAMGIFAMSVFFALEFATSVCYEPLLRALKKGPEIW